MRITTTPYCLSVIVLLVELSALKGITFYVFSSYMRSFFPPSASLILSETQNAIKSNCVELNYLENGKKLSRFLIIVLKYWYRPRVMLIFMNLGYVLLGEIETKVVPLAPKFDLLFEKLFYLRLEAFFFIECYFVFSSFGILGVGSNFKMVSFSSDKIKYIYLKWFWNGIIYFFFFYRSKGVFIWIAKSLEGHWGSQITARVGEIQGKYY